MARKGHTAGAFTLGAGALERHDAHGRREGMAREVAATWLGGLKAEMRVGTHRVVSDEPVDHGGDDSGPTPVDYVLVALTA